MPAGKELPWTESDDLGEQKFLYKDDKDDNIVVNSWELYCTVLIVYNLIV